MTEEQQQTVPAALQAQMDALTQAPDQGTPQPDAQPPEATVTPPQTQEAPQEAPQVQPEAPTQTPQEQAAAKLADPNSETWQQKFRVMNGKLAAETRQHRLAMQERDAQIAQLQQQMQQQQQQTQQMGYPDGFQTTQPQQQQKLSLDAIVATISDEEIKSQISEEDINDFTMDYWKQMFALNRMNQQANAAQQTQQPSQELTQRLDYLESTQKQERDRVFFADLTSLVPQWEEVEGTEQFQKWKTQIEPMTGLAYEDLVERAYYDNDPVRAATLFEQHIASIPSATQPPPGKTIESQVVPDNGGAVEPQQNQGESMSLADWQKEMIDLTKGNYTPERAQERHKELDALMRSGRVVVPAGAQVPI